MLRPPVEPMLARPVEQLPHDRALPGGCGYEPKVPGYRALLFVSDSGCYVQSRRGKDLSGSFPDIAAATGQLPPGMVVEVSADNAYEHGRWRHLTRFVRARPDLTPDVVTPPADRP